MFSASSNLELDPTNLVQNGENDPAEGTGLISRDHFIWIGHIMSQIRRLDELREPTNYAINRATSSSVLGCVSSQVIIEADYTRSTEDVCLQVATNILMRSKNLSLLHTVQYDDGDAKLDDATASWVPRWDRPQIHSYLGLLSHFKPWKPDKTSNLLGSIGGNILTTPGIIVDTISSSTDRITKDTLFNKSSSMRFWKSIISYDLSPHVSNGLQKAQTYQRTLTARNIHGRIGSVIDPRFGHEQLWDNFAAFWSELYDADHAIGDDSTGPKIFLVPELEEAAKRGKSWDFLALGHLASRNRRVFCTKRGFLGLGPGILQLNDVICILPSSVPFVLRPVDSHYLLVGKCYVDGIMNGEEMDMFKISAVEIH
jgi:hypothetical protein